MGAYRVVWMPGLGDSPHDGERVAAALGPAFQVVSEPPGVEGVALVGHSFGCVPALRFAADHPAEVDAVVLTSGFYPPARDGRSLASAMADYGRHRMLYARSLAGRGRAPRPTTGAARRLASLARLGLHPQAFHELAEQVRCPVLLVHGAEDHVVPVAFAHAAAARHPAWTYREVPDAGHYLHRDCPAAWAEIVRTWLTPRTSRHERAARPAGDSSSGIVLRTARLILTPLTRLDEAEHARASGRPADALRDTRAGEVQWRDHGFGPWAIRDIRGGGFLGVAELRVAGHGIEGIDPDETEAGWWVAEERRNQGIATEAMCVAIDDLWARTDIDWVTAYISEGDNDASRRVAAKLGFVMRGPGRGRSGEPMTVFELRREDWQRRGGRLDIPDQPTL